MNCSRDSKFSCTNLKCLSIAISLLRTEYLSGELCAIAQDVGVYIVYVLHKHRLFHSQTSNPYVGLN